MRRGFGWLLLGIAYDCPHRYPAERKWRSRLTGGLFIKVGAQGHVFQNYILLASKRFNSEDGTTPKKSCKGFLWLYTCVPLAVFWMYFDLEAHLKQPPLRLLGPNLDGYVLYGQGCDC